MATGRIRFYAQTQGGQTEISYVIPNDIPAMVTEGNRSFDRPMKALYLLHGYSGNDADWEYNGIAEELALRYNLAVFMLTAGNNFYLDREATGRQYSSFAGKEAVEYTRRLFGLSGRREDTLIGGLSMGGFGALHTALAFPETFGGAVALSSALIIHAIAGMKPGTADAVANYAYYREVFGDLGAVGTSDANPEVLYRRCAAENRPIPPIYMAVGTEDFLYENNQEFRRFLEEAGADFCYEEGPGIHDWKFWNQYILNGVEWILKRTEEA
ncbi:alpha/beta hydrolase [Lachnoclostridium sp. Marseille-P6806]|uniref:alpha/beta hydrolase n=1 Tax=Lachnoclostridium sp. Marseille-P6806 TaxID=2364793 RepID=UPI00102F980F|nr:alpha/beta hydrolase-fold protein [Lachnoclostridium sp. Marseille-P6806]